MTWKKEYAGRRIKCKHCGQAMVVPAKPNRPEPEPAMEDDLYALSDLVSDAQQAAAALPPTIVDPVAMAAPAPVPAAAPAAKKTTKSGIPLAYQRPMSQGEKERAASAGHVDKNREVYVPLVMILAGATLYLSFYAVRYHMGMAGVIFTGIGMAITTVIETGILFGFALAIAGPLGVSFGGIGTALLKFASISVLTDGVATWIQGLIFGHGFVVSNGIMGYGAVSFSIALGIFWVSLIYLFSMDPGDSWLVVVIISVFSFILRMAVVLLLLNWLLSFGGAGSSVPVAGGASSGSGSGVNTELIDSVEEAKEHGRMEEAKKYAGNYGRRAEAGVIQAWYDAGAKNVWYEMDRDINGKGEPYQLVIELPDDKASRTKCYDAAKKFLTDNDRKFAADDLKDENDPYMICPLP